MDPKEVAAINDIHYNQERQRGGEGAEDFLEDVGHRPSPLPEAKTAGLGATAVVPPAETAIIKKPGRRYLQHSNTPLPTQKLSHRGKETVDRGKMPAHVAAQVRAAQGGPSPYPPQEN